MSDEKNKTGCERCGKAYTEKDEAQIRQLLDQYEVTQREWMWKFVKSVAAAVSANPQLSFKTVTHIVSQDAGVIQNSEEVSYPILLTLLSAVATMEPTPALPVLPCGCRAEPEGFDIASILEEAVKGTVSDAMRGCFSPQGIKSPPPAPAGKVQ